MSSIDKLYLNLNGIKVGCLTRAPGGEMHFEYFGEWLKHPACRPISLSLPLSSRRYAGERVYNFFDNLLPDSPRIRARLQRRFHLSNDRPFDLLRCIGRDCVGAIQLTAEEDIPNEPLRCRALKEEEIAALLRQYETAPLGITEESDDFRISIAGAQEKTALTRYRGRWCLPSGTTPTTHIFKRPIGRIEHSGLDLQESCENEWLCLELLRGFGFTVPEAEVCLFEDQKALVVERFDRRWADDKSRIYRLPQEDMCQALGYSPNLKYESDGGPGIQAIMQLLLGSRTAESDRRLFMMSQVVFWLMAAIDGHAKNYSIFLEAGNRFCLTPMYDVMSTFPLIGAGSLQQQKVKMAMALQGKNRHYGWYRIQPGHFLSTARAVGYSVELISGILEEVADSVSLVIDKVAGNLPDGFPEHIAGSIFKGMEECRNMIGKGLKDGL